MRRPSLAALTGPVLLLLPGFSNDRRLSTKHGWIMHLQPAFTVIIMDMRGCVDRDAPPAPNASCRTDLTAPGFALNRDAAESFC